MSSELEEKPEEYRTQKEHWYIYPRAGVIAVHSLKPSPDGLHLVPGMRKFRMRRDELQQRPDILKRVVDLLSHWRMSC